MLRYLAKPAATVLAVLFVLRIVSAPASAAVGIVVSPVKMDVVLDTGETSIREIRIHNSGNESTIVRVYAMDFSIDRENNYTFSEPGHESYSCTSWLSIEQSEFLLPAGETRQVAVTISVPQQVEPGGHYAALFFETVPPDTEPGVSVAVAGRIPSLFYLTIPGVTDADIVANAEISSLMLPGWVDGGPVDIGAVVRNTGNVHLTIATKAYFTDFRGRPAGEIDLGQTTVLPGAERAVTGTLEGTPFAGRVKANFVIGYFDDHEELVNKSMGGSFWIIPWQAIIITIGSIVLLVIAVLVLRSKFRLKLERRQSDG
jgi:P pilus assembly chaperone PapD